MDPELFEKAADLIDDHGWWDGGNGGDDIAPHCVMTAIYQVQPAVIAVRVEAHRVLREFLGLDDTASALGEWNDSCLDGSEVTNVLRKCAEHIRGAA